MSMTVFLAGLAIWLLLAAGSVALLVAEGRRECHPDEAVLSGEFDRPAYGPLDDIEPRFAEWVDDENRSALSFVTDCERDDTAASLPSPLTRITNVRAAYLNPASSIRHAYSSPNYGCSTD